MAGDTAGTRRLTDKLREAQLRDIESEVQPEQTTLFQFPYVYLKGTAKGEPKGQFIFTIYGDQDYTVEIRSAPHPGGPFCPSIGAQDFSRVLSGLWTVEYEWWRSEFKIKHDQQLKQESETCQTTPATS